MKGIFGTLFPKGSSEGIRGVFIPVRPDSNSGSSDARDIVGIVVGFLLLSWWVLGNFEQALGFSVLVGILSLFGLGGIVALLVLGGGIVWKALQWGPAWIQGMLVAVLVVVGLFVVVADSTRFWVWRCAVLLVGIAVWHFTPFDPLVGLIDRYMRPETDLAGRGLAGTTAEWIQDWGVATDRTRMTARLGRDSSGPTLTVHDRFCGFCSEYNPLASPARSPRYTVKIGKCSAETGRVSCDGVSIYHADPSLGTIRTTFELDLSKRSGQLTFHSKDGSTLVNRLYNSPSSMSGAPAWLHAQSKAIGPGNLSVAQGSTLPLVASPIETHIGNIALSRNGQWMEQAKYQQTQASVQARQRQAESEATAVHQKAQVEAQSALQQAQAEARKRYQVDRATGPAHGDKATGAGRATTDNGSATAQGFAHDKGAPSVFTETWQATVNQPGYGSYPAVMQLHQDQAGGSAGTIEYPSLRCVGSLILLKTEKQILWFRETIQQGRGKCLDGGLIVITPNSSSVLGWQYFRPDNASSPLATATFTTSQGQGELRTPAQEPAARRTLEQEAVEQRNDDQPTEKAGKSDTAQTDTESSNGNAPAAATLTP